MTDHIIIQFVSAKMSLVSAHSNGKYILKFGNRQLEMDPIYEAWFGSCLCSKQFGPLAKSISNVYQDVSSQEINLCFETFYKEHTFEPVKYSFADIPLFADEQHLCDIKSPYHTNIIALNVNEEKEILNIISDETIKFKMKRIIGWFYRYRIRYGIESKLKKYSKFQDEELALQFCYIHGVCPNMLEKKEVAVMPNSIPLKKRIENFILSALIVILYIYLSVLLIQLGQSIDNFVLSGIIMLFGVCMIIVPLVLMFKKQ